jgi:hypothetical protein
MINNPVTETNPNSHWLNLRGNLTRSSKRIVDDTFFYSGLYKNNHGCVAGHYP